MKPKSTPESADLRERALAYLARREHSRAELARKLERAGFPAGDIAVLLNEFEEKTWLSDRRFAESWAADHRAKAGSVKLAYELRQHGVASEIIDAVLAAACDDELERAREVWKKKFGTPPANTAETARQIRFLQSRGFTRQTIRHALNGAGNSADD
jgi:regulatory protein